MAHLKEVFLLIELNQPSMKKKQLNVVSITQQLTSCKSQWFTNSLLRNGRAAQRPAGPDDGSRLGAQSADTHREQVIQYPAVCLPLVLCAKLFQRY